MEWERVMPTRRESLDSCSRRIGFYWLSLETTHDGVEFRCHAFKVLGTFFDLTAAAGHLGRTLVDHGDILGDLAGCRRALVDVLVDLLDALGGLADVGGDFTGGDGLLLHCRGHRPHDFVDAVDHCGDFFDALDGDVGAALDMGDFVFGLDLDALGQIPFAFGDVLEIGNHLF